MSSDQTSSQRPVALVILDGWGYAPRTEANAIAMAHTPYYDAICRDFPMTTLAAAGESVNGKRKRPARGAKRNKASPRSSS